MDTAIRDWIALSLVPGLGPRLTAALLERFGSAAGVRAATADQLQSVPKIGAKLAREFAEALARVDVDAELERMNRHGVRAICMESPEYPPLMRTIYDPPPVLFVRGSMVEADQQAVAVVGTRQASQYGRRLARSLGRDLVRHGITVVSGLALGIDGEAHRGALEGKGRTIAVLAGGLAKISPPSHRPLAGEVAASGCLFTESPTEVEPQPGMFLPRNRLVSGMCRAVVVVEAGERSGALVTARLAAEQGREVFAFPGEADRSSSAGTHKLIRDGGRLIRGIDDLLEDLGGVSPLLEPSTSDSQPSVQNVPRAAPITPPNLNETQQRIWDFLSEPRFLDEISAFMGISVGSLRHVMTQLEIRKIVSALPGSRYERR